MAQPALNVTVPEFAQLVREHQSLVFSIAYHFLRDAAEAEELAQDVFVQLHRDLAKLESPDHVIAWLRRVTVHRCIDHKRAKARRRESALDDVPEPMVSPRESDPLLSQKLRQLVAGLPVKMRLVVILRYTEELGPEEIARLLGMPVASVKSYLHRGLAMLREKARRMFGEMEA